MEQKSFSSQSKKNINKNTEVWFNDLTARTQKNKSFGTVEYSLSSINKIEHAEDWISICFTLESQKAIENMENFWQAGLDKFHKSLVYLESIGFYYFRAGKHHKALKYLKKAHEMSHSPLAIKIAIASAYALAQYHLVWDYFQLLHEPEKESIEDDTISKVATAALHQGLFQEAESLFELLGSRHDIKPLPSLESMLLKNFGNQENIENFHKNILEKSKSQENRKSVSLQEWIAFASILMYREKYQEAVEILTTVKEESYS